MSGSTEEAAFRNLPLPSERDVERVAHLVLMALLPSLADADLATFGRALTAIQSITGRWFAAVQGGTFAAGWSDELVHRMAEWGAVGVGQSSWGPAVYGIVDGEEASLRLADRVHDVVGTAGTVHHGPFRTEGARVWREAGGPPLSQDELKSYAARAGLGNSSRKSRNRQ
jgi:beta-RFAP synthase